MDTLELHPQPHPNQQIRRIGFELTHPYLEQCWGAALGPSAVALLRRSVALWAQQVPARLPAGELAESLGIGGGANSRFDRAVDRLVRFRFATWLEPDRALGIYTEVAPLTENALRRLPTWTRDTHDRLLGEHLDHIATRDTQHSTVADITSRLDRLQQPKRSLDHNSPANALHR